MTESEWLSCRDPVAMLRSLGSKVSQRALRLIACACCRLTWDALTDEGQEAVACVERFADGQVSADELDTAVGRANEVVATYRQGTPAYCAALAIRNAGNVGKFDAWHASLAAESAVEALRIAQSARDGTDQSNSFRLAAATDATCGLIRDVAGRVFMRARLGRGTLTGTVRGLARAAYDERVLVSGRLDADRLAVLADALEDAGCDRAAIMGHLRGPGPHVRGCWPVDLCLGLR